MLDPAAGASRDLAERTPLLKSHVDFVTIRTPRGTEELGIIAIRSDQLF
jgi:hypothetical protein